MSGAARTAGAVLVSLVLLTAGAAATVTAPSDDELQDPIEVRGIVGQTLSARTAEVLVHDVRAAERVDFGSTGPDSTTPGVWIAIDLTVACRERLCSFDRSELRSRGRTYDTAVLAPRPSFAALYGEPLLRYRTTALFEVPRAVLGDGSAELVVQSIDTPALDSLPVVRLTLPRTASASVPVRTASVAGVTR